ncbi:hypothetical protein MMB75_25635 [Paenibacillus sp. P2(2022)]|uniref:hypothetical protein n=1 Tax=Paenibacillus sp. P2(2022) TaxID=2917813 RepID=UPI0024066270|nr:hypothetical protein [Paenibacillus sp. P2(2022)]MDG0057012.1 hypothetical protein [Paenibacillus sp. P2(2022)]
MSSFTQSRSFIGSTFGDGLSDLTLQKKYPAIVDVIEEYSEPSKIKGTTPPPIDVSSYYEVDQNGVAIEGDISEVKEAIFMYKKVVMGFFSFGIVGIVALTSFLVLGITNTISIIPSLFGVILSAGLLAGIYCDYQKWEKRNV